MAEKKKGKKIKKEKDTSTVQCFLEILTVDVHLKEFDKDAVIRFIGDARARKPLDKNDAMQAATALFAIIQGSMSKDNMTKEIKRMFEIKSPRKKELDLGNIVEGTTEWFIFTAFVHGHFTRAKTVSELAKLDNVTITDKQIERVLDGMSPYERSRFKTGYVLMEHVSEARKKELGLE